MTNESAPPKKPRGRPPKPEGALSGAQRIKSHRERLKAELKEKGYTAVWVPIKKDEWQAAQKLAHEYSISGIDFLKDLIDRQLAKVFMYALLEPEQRQKILADPSYYDIYASLNKLPGKL